MARLAWTSLACLLVNLVAANAQSMSINGTAACASALNYHYFALQASQASACDSSFVGRIFLSCFSESGDCGRAMIFPELSGM